MIRRKATAIALALGLFLPTAVDAASSQDQLTEAQAFFNQIASQSKNPYIASLAQENLRKLSKPSAAEAESRQQVEVPLMSRTNNGLAVPVLVNRKTAATFIVDTGATYTVITPRFAKKLGVVVTPETPRLTIITANGPVRAPIVTLNNVAIGGVEASGVKAIVQDLGDDLLLSGLLGMNYFKDMDITIKQNKLVLSINNAS